MAATTTAATAAAAAASSSSSSSDSIKLRRRGVVVVSSPGAPDTCINDNDNDNDNSNHPPQRCSLRVTIIITLDLSSNTAFFKLQIPVTLRAASSSSSSSSPGDAYGDFHTSVYLFIRPEQVASLAHVWQPPLPEGVSRVYKKLRDAVCFSFSLTVPASPVIPDVGSLVPKSDADIQMLRSFQLLAKQRALDIYLPSDALPESQASAICTAISSGRLASDPHHTNLQRIYGRNVGARVVPAGEMDDIVAPGVPTATPSASPPSYTDAAGTTASLGSQPLLLPPPLTQRMQESSAGKKRRRRSTPSSEVEVVESQESRKALQSLEEQVGTRIDQLRSLLLEVDKKEAQLRERMRDADQKLDRLAAAASASAPVAAAAAAEDEEDDDDDDRLSQAEVERIVDERLEDYEAEIHNVIDNRVDERLFTYSVEEDLVLRREMYDYVDERLQEVGTEIRDWLTNFPDM